MKNRYRIVKYNRRGGIYYLVDRHTGQRESLETTNKERANELLTAKNEATREPAFNLQKARIYLNASDPEIATRTWKDGLEAVIASKPKDSANRHRWETAAKELTGANALANGYAALKELNYYSYQYSAGNPLATVFGEPNWDADYLRDSVNRVRFTRQSPYDFHNSRKLLIRCVHCRNRTFSA